MISTWRWSDVLLIAILVVFAIPTVVGVLVLDFWAADVSGVFLLITACTLARIHATRRNPRESDAHSRP